MSDRPGGGQSAELAIGLPAEDARGGVVGRRQPYTARGIGRVPCRRCGAPSFHQWQVCANGNRWLGVCVACDVALNRVALEFMRVPNAEALLATYAPALDTGPSAIPRDDHENDQDPTKEGE